MARLPALAALALLTAAPSLPQPARHSAPAYGEIQPLPADSRDRPGVQRIVKTTARAPADQAIQMRALGVTPDYALRVARVLRAAGEIE
jgi:hypothetical protein